MDRLERAKEIFEATRNTIPGTSDTWELAADYIEKELLKERIAVAKEIKFPIEQGHPSVQDTPVGKTLRFREAFVMLNSRCDEKISKANERLREMVCKECGGNELIGCPPSCKRLKEIEG